MHSTRSSAQRSQPPPSSSRPASRSVACLPYLEEIVIYVLQGAPTASIKADCTNPRPGNPLYLKRSFSLPSISLGLPFRWSERLLGLQPDIAPTPLGGGKKGAPYMRSRRFFFSWNSSSVNGGYKRLHQYAAVGPVYGGCRSRCRLGCW